MRSFGDMARKKKKRPASRGSVNNIILRTLVNGDKYGYEIIKEVEEYSNGKIQLKQPSLYSSLSRFEEKQYVTSYWCDSEIGGRRHYYHLTELGSEFYKKTILKDSMSADSDSTQPIDDEEEYLGNDDEGSEFPNNDIKEAQDESILEEDEQEENDQEEYNEIPSDEIPAIVDFQQKEEEQKVIIPDHNFYTHTPMETLIETKEDQSFAEEEQSIDEEQTLTPTQTQETPPISASSQEETQNTPLETTPNERPWEEISNQAKISNGKVSKSKFNKLYTKKPKKVQRVILDKDGIYKLRDEDYVPIKRSTKPIIIDNVGKRTKDSGVFGYTTYTETKKESTSSARNYTELSDEEKRKRNENFLAKFNLLTNSKMKPISTPTPKIEEKQPEKQIDYRGKLDAVIESSASLLEDEEDPFVELNEEDNLFNYEKTTNWNESSDSSTSAIADDDGEIELEPEEEFETKSTDNQYIENINSYPSSVSEVKINRYENKSNAILVDKTYILANKLKFVFGIILSLIMIAEVTICYLSFKNNGVIFEGDNVVIILAYTFVGIFALACILPYAFNHNQHKANTFKFKYAIWFGLLTFLVLAILIYCFNALAGFELDNFKYFTVKIIIPMVLSSNFLIAPIIYGLLNKNKAFYD